MLVKKVKTIHMVDDGGEPTDKRLEDRYVLTADIDTMAALIGLSSDVLRRVFSYGLECSGATYYGEAQTADYFRAAANHVNKPRKLELRKMHLRITERVKTDASGSFLIVPVTITDPGFVGDISHGYELIPHIVATPREWADSTGTAISVFQPDVNSIVQKAVTQPSEIDLKLVGFDLLLCDELTEPEETFPATVFESPSSSNQVVYDYGFGIKVTYTFNPSDGKMKVAVTHDGRYGTTQLHTPTQFAGGGQYNPYEVISTTLECKYVDDICTGWLLKQPGWEEGRRTLSEVVRFLNEGYLGLGWRNA